MIVARSLKQIYQDQVALCKERGAAFEAAAGDSKIGLAVSTDGRSPANGLRYPPIGDTTRWYIWFGDEFSTAADFFAPVHASHLYEQHPELSRLLGLPPGYRFLLAGACLDVWFDADLLKI